MTIAGVLLLAVLDSINPSAIVVTLFLLSTAGSRALVQVATYVGAIFVTYLLLGVLMLLGVASLLPSMDALTGFVAQSAIGLLLLVYSLTAPSPPAPAPAIAQPTATNAAALVLLGVTVTAMEVPTALPYFAAIGLISGAGLPARSWAPLLVLYDVIFILPPIALLLGHLLVERRLTEPYAALRQRLESGARETALWVAGLVGGGLFVTGVIECVARLR